MSEIPLKKKLSEIQLKIKAPKDLYNSFGKCTSSSISSAYILRSSFDLFPCIFKGSSKIQPIVFLGFNELNGS